MPDQLFTYYIENPLRIISINSQIWMGGRMVIRLAIDFGELVKVALKMGVRERGGKVVEVVYGLLGFVKCVLGVFLML
jgi:hypothetical protein